MQEEEVTEVLAAWSDFGDAFSRNGDAFQMERVGKIDEAARMYVQGLDDFFCRTKL